MITLALVTLAATIAVPNYQTMIQNNHLSAQTNLLVSTLNFARSEAIKRNVAITLTANDTNIWHSGWLVAGLGNATIRSQAAFEGDTTLVANASLNTITYRPTGFLQGNTSASFSLCDSRTGETGRTIHVSTTGYINIHNLTCP